MIGIECTKEHLSNIWSLINEKVKQHWGWVEKALLFKKTCAVWCISNNCYQQEDFHWYDLNIFSNTSKQKNRNNKR